MEAEELEDACKKCVSAAVCSGGTVGQFLVCSVLYWVLLLSGRCQKNLCEKLWATGCVPGNSNHSWGKDN